MTTRLIATLLLSVAAACAYAAGPEERVPSDRARPPARDAEAASFLSTPSDAESVSPADRGKYCNEEARARRLRGDDLRFFMINCMHR